LTEDRPYRAGMDREGTMKILDKLSGPALEPDIVALLRDNFESINEARKLVQGDALAQYKNMQQLTN